MELKGKSVVGHASKHDGESGKRKRAKVFHQAAIEQAIVVALPSGQNDCNDEGIRAINNAWQPIAVADLGYDGDDSADRDELEYVRNAIAQNNSEAGARRGVACAANQLSWLRCKHLIKDLALLVHRH